MIHPACNSMLLIPARDGSSVVRRIAAVACLTILLGIMTGCSRSPDSTTGSSKGTVIIYTSQDEEYAEPIFKDFQGKTGIEVKAVYDSEAVKTVGLVNRILAEQSHPQCDVFWNNEEFRTRVLASKNIFEPANGWTLLGYRSRRIIINSKLLAPFANATSSFSGALKLLPAAQKLTLAYPLFGTTCTHFLALRQAWGEAAWKAWCQQLTDSHCLLVEGNSSAARMVGSGEAMMGFTDSDDAASEQAAGKPVEILPPADDTLIIHNSEGIIRGCPHPEAARQLFQFLQSHEVQQKLVDAHALESADPGDPAHLPGLKVNWDQLIADMDKGTEELRTLFLR